jgi:hypothetical protein
MNTTIGLTDLIAETPDEVMHYCPILFTLCILPDPSVACRKYVEIAQRLAADKGRLQKFRVNLRDDFLRSPLGDGPRYQQNVEAMYQVIAHATFNGE